MLVYHGGYALIDEIDPGKYPLISKTFIDVTNKKLDHYK
jgi:hypothetical protein